MNYENVVIWGVLITSLLYFMSLPIQTMKHIEDDFDVEKLTMRQHNYLYYPGIIPRNRANGNMGFMEIKVPGIWNINNYNQLAMVCNTTPKCVAYDTNGNLYSGTEPKTDWRTQTDENPGGVFVNTTYKIPVA